MLFPVERNFHRGEARNREILIVAAPSDFEWVGWLKQQVVDSDNPALGGVQVCTPVSPDAYRIAEDEFSAALARAWRMLFVCTAAFDQSSAPHWQAFGSAWSADPSGMQRKAVPILVDDYRPGGLIAGIVAIDLRAFSLSTAGLQLTTQLARSVSGHFRPAQAPEFPG